MRADMLLLVALLSAVVTMAHGSAKFSSLPRHVLLPSGHGWNVDQCYDPQIHRSYFVGEVWSTSGCKQSQCIEKDGRLYIDRYSCPNIMRSVDRQKVRDQHLFCRHAYGDRRRAFPDCCPLLVCKHFDEQHRLVPLPADMYPWL